MTTSAKLMADALAHGSVDRREGDASSADVARMRRRIEAALLSKDAKASLQVLSDAIDLDAEELEEAMLDLQARIDHIEAPGAAAPPRYIRNSAHRAIGPNPVTNASLENWHGTLVHQSDHQRTLAGFSKRLSPEVMRTHTRQRASELARHGSSSAQRAVLSSH